ncbi:hypothetical protein [Megalodesulfovibrio paquesii]
MRFVSIIATLAVLFSLVFPMALLAQNAPAAAKPEAQQQKPAPAPPATPAAASKPGVPLAVEHQGGDAVGGSLAYKLKDLAGRSSLFQLSTVDEKRIKLLIRTQEEFKDRPNDASIYSAVWVYSESESTLKYFLDVESGLVFAGSADAKAQALLSKTQELASRYGYLFE